MKKNFTIISICLAFILAFTATNVLAGENQYKIGSGDILYWFSSANTLAVEKMRINARQILMKVNFFFIMDPFFCCVSDL